MSVTTHERPGVYSEYDASSVVQGRQGRKMVGMAAIHATAPAGVPQTVTSYEGALIAFGSTGGQDMTELIRLALKNGAAGVVAVPVADEEGYEAAFAALAAVTAWTGRCSSPCGTAPPPPLPPAGRGSRWPPAGRARR